MQRGDRLMFDLSKPVPAEVIVGSIVFIFALVGVGLALVAFYKRKYLHHKKEEQ
jgi:hypothetical protein